MHPKAHGKSAEWLFAYEAVEHNWVPLVEPTDALPYDVVLVKHCSSTFIKCQVKMTASERKNRDGFYNVNLSKGAGANKRLTYTMTLTFGVCTSPTQGCGTSYQEKQHPTQGR